MLVVCMKKQDQIPLLDLNAVNLQTTPKLNSVNSAMPGVIQAQIRVLFNNTSLLQSDEDMMRVRNVLEAKKALCARTDVEQYITADDLLRIQQTKTPVRLRLCIDDDRSSRRFSIDGKTAKHSTRSPTRDNTPQHSPTRTLRHNKSVENESRREAPLVLNSGQFRLIYTTKTTATYKWIIIEEHSPGKLLCRGVDEMSISGEVLVTYEYSTVANSNSHFTYTVYSPSFCNTSLPIYLHVPPTTIDRIVEMLSDLITQAQTQYDANDISHQVDATCLPLRSDFHT